MPNISPAAFLAGVWRPAPAGSWGELRAYRKPGGARARSGRLPFDSLGFARLFAWASELNAEGWHIALGVQPRTRRASGTNVGRSRDVDSYVALPLDFDDLDAAELAVARLVAAGVPPSAIVSSGRGQHVYLFLAIAEPASDAEPVASRLCHWTGSDATFDPPRVMRLPGSTNPKPAAGGRVATVEVFEPEQRYGLQQVVDALDRAGAPAALPKSSGPGAGSGRVPPAPAARPVTPQRRDELVAALSPRMRALVEHGDHGGAGYPSRSEASLAVARALQKAGASEEEVAALLLASPVGAEVVEKGDRRLRRILNLVRSAPVERAASTVKVLGVRRQLDDGRVDLRLEVIEGPYSGRCWWQHLAPLPDLWRHVSASAGREPCSTSEALVAVLPLGTVVRVRLREVVYRGDSRVEVSAWLPAQSKSRR